MTWCNFKGFSLQQSGHSGRSLEPGPWISGPNPDCEAATTTLPPPKHTASPTLRNLLCPLDSETGLTVCCNINVYFLFVSAEISTLNALLLTPYNFRWYLLLSTPRPPKRRRGFTEPTYFQHWETVLMGFKEMCLDLFFLLIQFSF